MTTQGAKGSAVGLSAVVIAVLGALIWWAFGQPPKSTPAAVAAPEVTAEPAVPSEPAAAPAPAMAPEPPRFDVVRVDKTGLATIAGLAPAGAEVVLVLDGAEVARARADGVGQFAALVTLPPSNLPRLMSLLAVLPDGTELAGVETVAIGPVAAPMPAPEAAAEPAPQAVPEPVLPEATAKAQADAATAEATLAEPAPPPTLLLSDTGATVLQPPAPAADALAAPVSIDSISYGPQGEVMLAGRAAPGASLRLYLDDQAMKDVAVGDDGRWQAQLPEVAAGLHALRADQIDGEGKVSARFETPFKREVPVAVVAAPATPDPNATEPAPVVAPAPITITVQPGLTLWAIARENFGDGVMYVQVFEANRDKIKDPDLIYPGQVFTVPKP